MVIPANALSPAIQPNSQNQKRSRGAGFLSLFPCSPSPFPAAARWILLVYLGHLVGLLQ